MLRTSAKITVKDSVSGLDHAIRASLTVSEGMRGMIDATTESRVKYRLHKKITEAPFHLCLHTSETSRSNVIRCSYTRSATHRDDQLDCRRIATTDNLTERREAPLHLNNSAQNVRQTRHRLNVALTSGSTVRRPPEGQAHPNRQTSWSRDLWDDVPNDLINDCETTG